ncbi:MAG: hypothetical protein AAF805_00245 [Planctomycetota bacterium]
MLRTAMRVTVYPETINRTLASKRRRVLYRVASYVRVTMARRIRRRKKKNAPAGQAPFGKTGALKRNVRFHVDERRGRAAIYFVSFRSAAATPLGGKSVPKVIDEGGRARLHQRERTVTRVERGGRNADGTFAPSTVREKRLAPRSVTARFAPRPVTDPVRPTAQAKLEEFARSEALR